MRTQRAHRHIEFIKDVTWQSVINLIFVSALQLLEQGREKKTFFAIVIVTRQILSILYRLSRSVRKNQCANLLWRKKWKQQKITHTYRGNGRQRQDVWNASLLQLFKQNENSKRTFRSFWIIDRVGFLLFQTVNSVSVIRLFICALWCGFSFSIFHFHQLKRSETKK